MTKLHWILLVAAPLSAGCGLFGKVTEDNFNDKFAEEICNITKDCNQIVFEGAYDGDMAECIDDQTDQRKDYDDLYDGCDFDDGHAEDCIASLQEAQCGDFYDYEDAQNILEDCYLVWDCN